MIVGTVTLTDGEVLTIDDDLAVESSLGADRSRELTDRLRAEPPRTWEGDPGFASLKRVSSWFPGSFSERDDRYEADHEPGRIY